MAPAPAATGSAGSGGIGAESQEPLHLPRFGFITGPAGSGKTTLVREWVQRSSSVVICATTGIAAVNLGDAVTLHATLKYFNTESLQENWLSGRLQSRMRKLRASGLTHFCIDECSMLPAEQLTCLVDAVDELNSEGAVAMGDEPEVGLTLIGDFLQLPPIKASYAFQSPRWESHFEGPAITRLDRIWRQDDPTFIQGLRAVRVGDAAGALEIFADRFLPALDPHFSGTTIVARNDAVDRFNRMRHESLKGELFRFPAQITGTPLPEWEKDIPAAVGLKRGAFVVLLANKYDGYDYGWQELRYANGDQGILVDADPARKVAYVELVRNRKVVTVEYNIRQNLEPTGKRSGPKESRFKVLGEICYLPARLAWASTVHKSQGLTLPLVQVDLNDPMFRKPAMTYVALSRAQTLSGLRLIGNPRLFEARCSVDSRVQQWC